MSVQKLAGTLLLSIAVPLALVAQEQPSKTIKHVPVKSTSPASGKQMFVNYCASCHGADGKGDGPAAAALKTPPQTSRFLAKTMGESIRH